MSVSRRGCLYQCVFNLRDCKIAHSKGFTILYLYPQHKIFSKSTKILRVYLTNWGSHSGYSITSTIRIHQILMFYLLRYHNTWFVSLFYHSLYLQFHIWQHSFRLRQYFQSGSFTSSSTSIWASLVAQLVKNPPAIREIWVWCLG